jgi:hypothetical protein
MAIIEVISVETATLLDASEKQLDYAASLFGMACGIRYGFQGSGGLWRAEYLFPEEHIELAADKFDSLEQLLTEKYGPASAPGDVIVFDTMLKGWVPETRGKYKPRWKQDLAAVVPLDREHRGA